jgi:hypothetical protein
MTFLHSHIQNSPISIELTFTGIEKTPSKVVYSLPKALVFQFWQDDLVENLVKDIVIWIQKGRSQDKCIDLTIATIRVMNSISETSNMLTMTISKSLSGEQIATFSSLPCTLESSFNAFSDSPIQRQSETIIPSLAQICMASLPWNCRMYCATYLEMAVNVMKPVAWVFPS